jgi:hypothetical protein
VLEGSDGTEGVGKSGLEMSEYLGVWPVCRGQFGHWAAAEESGAELASAEVEALPDTQQGAVAEMAAAGTDGSENAVGDGVLEEAPQGGGGQAEASDFVGGPDAEGTSAAVASIAVAAQDAACAEGFMAGTAVVKAVEKAVANEIADRVAVRTLGQLEAVSKGLPILVVAIKPALLGHVTSSVKMVIVGERGGAG